MDKIEKAQIAQQSAQDIINNCDKKLTKLTKEEIKIIEDKVNVNIVNETKEIVKKLNKEGK